MAGLSMLFEFAMLSAFWIRSDVKGLSLFSLSDSWSLFDAFFLSFRGWAARSTTARTSDCILVCYGRIYNGSVVSVSSILIHESPFTAFNNVGWLA